MHTTQCAAAATTPVRREWRTPELRELSADATAGGFVVIPDGPMSS